MYRLGTRAHKHHLGIAAGVIAVVMLVAAGVFSYKALHLTTAPKSKISNVSGTITRYDPDAAAKIAINEQLFTLDLPAGWQKATPQSTPVERPQYYFVSSSADARQLGVYIDAVPTNMALNKVVTVSGRDNMLDYENVSDNCAEYTQPDKANPGSGVAHGKWQGVEFICDLGNYQRNVVGTASTQGINQVTLTGATTGTHKVFMRFTDNSSSPDYTVFYAILASFKLK